MNDFKQENRYIVLKRTDVEGLSNRDLLSLSRLCQKVDVLRAKHGKLALKCVVVEKDWPEYQPTWDAIKKRVLGEPLNEPQKGPL